MKYTAYIVLSLLSVFTVLSFQNCGQPGMINLQSQSDLSKVDTTIGAEVLPGNDVSLAPVNPEFSNPQQGAITEEPKTPGADPDKVTVKDPGGTGKSCDDSDKKNSNDIISGGSNEHKEHDQARLDIDKESPDVEIDEEDGSLKRELQSCALLGELNVRAIFEAQKQNHNEYYNRVSFFKVENKESLNLKNYQGLAFLNNIADILSLENIKSILLFVNAVNIEEIKNVKANVLMRVESLGNISNFKGVFCLNAEEVKSINNFRGVLELQGNIKKISNFRGILKVKGNIEKLENFRGILKVDGDISSQTNVRVKSF
ncbi:MAG: hypothetical protein L6Q37_12490 [Bdellovibrionaceae bacterium]|nr:hypothetical protein [Pseudobdellovibrionaceae bacterium]NUM57282.1 hypothetical protein [Pseudobdellovibrionaceae bacterium]